MVATGSGRVEEHRAEIEVDVFGRAAEAEEGRLGDAAPVDAHAERREGGAGGFT